MHPHEQTKAEFRSSLAATWGYMPDVRLANQMHKNAVAQALGEGTAVPARVLRQYSGTDWSQHPLSRNCKPRPKRATVKANFYEIGMSILADGMTGFNSQRGNR